MHLHKPTRTRKDIQTHIHACKSTHVRPTCMHIFIFHKTYENRPKNITLDTIDATTPSSDHMHPQANPFVAMATSPVHKFYISWIIG